MIKKTITWEDYNGENRTEDFYFGFNEAELMKMDLKTPGGFEAFCERIVQTKDFNGMVDLLDELIMKSYGIKTPDGRAFHKSEELSKEFMETGAYVELVKELLSGEDKVTPFIEGVIPRKMIAQAKLAQAKREKEEEEKRLATAKEEAASTVTG